MNISRALLKPADMRTEQMHVDGFRFDLGSILTRAHSTWHPTELGPDGELSAVLSGGAATDAHGACLKQRRQGYGAGYCACTFRHSIITGTVSIMRGVVCVLP